MLINLNRITNFIKQIEILFFPFSWRGIIKQWDCFNISTKNMIGNGKNTSFWHDKWCYEINLEYEFEDLYESSVNKTKTKYHSISRWKLALEFRRYLTGYLVDRFYALLLCISQIQIGENFDMKTGS